MAANSFPLLAAPLFILMGNLMNTSGISYRIFDFAKAVVGWMRGGLCHANIVGSLIFAGMSGSAVADAAGMGAVEIEAMKKEGYDGGDRRCGHRRVGDDRADHPAVAADDRLRRRRRNLDRRAVRRRHHPRPADDGGADGHGSPHRDPRQPAAPSVRGRACAAGRVPARVLGADGAGGAVRRAAVRHLHADRGRCGRRDLRPHPRTVRLPGNQGCRPAEAHPRHRRDHRAS